MHIEGNFIQRDMGYYKSKLSKDEACVYQKFLTHRSTWAGTRLRPSHAMTVFPKPPHLNTYTGESRCNPHKQSRNLSINNSHD